MKPINKHPLRLLATSLLLLAAGCTDVHNDERNTPGAPIEIDFAVPTLASVNPATRALANTPLPVNSTVRITPYNKRKQVFEPSATYYVDASNKLQPYTSQNSDGSFVAGTKMQVILNDIYAFYFSTPALPITSDGHKQTVENNVDFASYISGDCRIMGNDSPTPPVLVRRCSQIVVQVKGIGSTTALTLPANDSFVQLMKLRSPQAGIAPGTYIPTTGGTTDQLLRITKGEASGKEVTFDPFCVLPCTSNYSFDIVVRLALTVTADNTPHTKTVTYSTKLANTEFKPGFQYNVTLTLDPEKAEVLPSVTITEWVDGGVVTTDPEKDYPYVTTNAAGKKCVMVAKDLFGQLAGWNFHAPWLQTPLHFASDANDALGHKFEVAQSDYSSVTAYATDVLNDWKTANAGCTPPWRMPTVSEMNWIFKLNTKLTGVDAFAKTTPPAEEGKPYNAYYWSSTQSTTETDINGLNRMYAANFTYPIESDPIELPVANNAPLRVRCVRDYGIASPNYAHVIDGKFIISQDEYGTTGGTFHPKWGSNEVPLHYREDVQYNTVSARFEVSAMLSEGESGNNARDMCAAHSQASGGVGTWRVPTMAEHFLMYDLRAQLPNGFFDSEYMSSTHYSKVSGQENYYWSFNPNWKDGYIQTYYAVVRCVRDY